MTKRMAATYKKTGLGRHSSSRRIIVVVVPPVDELDLVGPLQVFNSVNRLAGRNIYAIEVVTNADRLTIDGEGGVLTFVAKQYFNKVEGSCDSVLLVCGLGTRSVRDPALSAWLKKMAAEVRRLGAVCVGAFLIAEAGLLNGRRATTHWRFGREMATRYPSVRVQHDPLWVKDGNIYTSAGISAGIDLALAWVEEDCGAGLAHEAARELVLFLRRPGGQPQLSVSLASQASEMMSIRELQIWIAEHLQMKLSVADLADRMSMSVRNFERFYSRGGHDTVTIRASDARGGGASSARTHRAGPQTGGLRCWIRQRRRHETRLCSAVGDHSAPLSQARAAVDRRMITSKSEVIDHEERFFFNFLICGLSGCKVRITGRDPVGNSSRSKRTRALRPARK